MPSLAVPIRILIVDDHAMVRAGLRAFLDQEPDLQVVAEAATAEAALLAYEQHQPDVTLMDLRLPGRSGKDATQDIVQRWPQARIIVITTYEGDVHVATSLKAGARAYLLKDMLRQDVVSAIRKVHGGERYIAERAAENLASNPPDSYLTPRELSVLDLVAKGMQNREIARLLEMTEETVKAHLKHVFIKLGASDRTEAVTIAAQRGFLDL